MNLSNEMRGSQYIENDAQPYVQTWDPLLARGVSQAPPEGVPGVINFIKNPFDIFFMVGEAHQPFNIEELYGMGAAIVQRAIADQGHRNGGTI